MLGALRSLGTPLVGSAPRIAASLSASATAPDTADSEWGEAALRNRVDNANVLRMVTAFRRFGHMVRAAGSRLAAHAVSDSAFTNRHRT